jgi:hypothetical protein
MTTSGDEGTGPGDVDVVTGAFSYSVGPERPAFLEVVHFVKDAIGSRSQVVRLPGSVIPPTAPSPAWRCGTCCSPPRNTRRWPPA